MFAVALMLLALAGGAAATYFVMDAPRRQAVERAAAVARDRRRLDADRERHEDEVRRHEARARQLAAAVAANERRAGELVARETEFGRRVIAYGDLAAENQLLRAELKNATVHAAYLDHLHHADRSGASAASGRRDRLGRAYFDEVVAAARKGLTPGAYPTTKQRVRAAADRGAAAARVRAEGGDLPEAEVERALAGLHDLFERAVRAAVEREEQARLREQVREDVARQREVEAAEAAAEQAERERAAAEAALAAAVARALADAAGQHTSEVEALRARLAEAEAKSRRAVSLAQLTKQGHVYVISNVGSFGPGVFKIGMTRRKEPRHRVDELGDASVPFPFDVHMMVRCADAPGLEAALHRRFRAHRVNRVNLRKEFFRVTIDEVVAAVRENHGEVEYRADAEALEYLNSQSATAADVSEIERAFAGAEERTRHPDVGGR